MLRSELREEKSAIAANLVAQTCVPFGTHLLLYRLLKTQGLHIVEVTLEGETAMLFVKEGEGAALSLYSKLSKGAVTPCTAEDIWEDLQREF